MLELVCDCLVIAGLAVVCGAVGAIYPPAGWIAAGLALTAIGLTMGRIEAQARRKQRRKGRTP